MEKIVNALYGDIGKKLKILAVICGGIGLAAIVLGILVEASGGGRYNGRVLLTSCILGVICFISSWPLYAFGQLVDDVHQIKEHK